MQPMPLVWMAPPEGGAGDIHVLLSFSHRGGTSMQVLCDWPDTGSGEIPASLIDALIAQGVGFPFLSIDRESVDSVKIEPGCVEFVMDSADISVARSPSPQSAI
jgi:hypothetical protein